MQQLQPGSMFQVVLTCKIWCDVICKYVCLRAALTPDGSQAQPVYMLCIYMYIPTKASGDLFGDGAEVTG